MKIHEGEMSEAQLKEIIKLLNFSINAYEDFYCKTYNKEKVVPSQLPNNIDAFAVFSVIHETKQYVNIFKKRLRKLERLRRRGD